ncbi:Ig-like domain-containing protein [Turneriella parva]|uniref:Fibronectin type III domain protein n=1 Tax=Turneriella parva (strain ATCC BAA-1111 / DSM 21527 / NCTC 11395 / H) TaxID=869212 RepID=I4BBR5_TURPD|nr:Ig-like domain-containing protein [Turneriella parva]AFM14722.1 Fibronectin type III domain protein [Turneriella parva DSM 21527]
MLKTKFARTILTQVAALGLIMSTANCTGKTYSTFFQPFDLVFGARANSSTNIALLTATPLTNTRVMLTFSKPVTLASGQLVSNYRITAPNGNLLQILAASRDPNNSSIIFIDTLPQTSGTVYTATASNIVGVDGSSLGNSNSATFTAPTNADQTGPQFSSVSVIAGTTSATTLEVFFNEAVDRTSGETNTNYFVRANTCGGASTNVATAVRDVSNYAKVTLTTSTVLTVGTTYVVCGQTGLRDMWGNSNAAEFASAQFVYTAPTPRVLSAVSTSSTSVLVTFDQAMANAIQPTPAVNSTPLTTRANYAFTNCGALSASAATFSVVNSSQILLTGLTSGTAGTCTVTVNTAISSALGSALTAATNRAIFSYTSSAATDTTPPAVVGVTTTNSTTIVVTFSENVTGASIADFNLSPALNITNVSCTGNVCTLTTAEQSTTPYSLSITNNDGGIQDTATPANTLSTGSTTFTGDGAPYIVAIYPVDSSTVMVEWSEAIGPRSSIDDTTAGDGFDYTLSPLVATDISEVRLSPTGGAAGDYSPYVRISLATAMASGTTYTLAYSDVAPTGGQDATGNGLLTTVPNGGTFTGPTSTQAPRVTSASSNAATTVIVNFNETLNNATIDNGDFVLSGPVGCPAVVTGTPIQVSAGVVQLVVTTVSQAGPTTCTVTVNTVSDLAGNAIGGTNNSANFSYSGTDATDETSPTVVSVSALSNTQVRIYFSEPVNDSNGVNGGENFTDNYSFSPALSGSIASADCPSPYTYCTLTLSAPGTSAVQYALTVRNIEDRASPTPRIMSSQTVNFSGIGSSVTAPTLYQAVLINSTTVELSFTESMGLTSVECTSTGTCATKYTVTGGNSVSAAVRQADTTKVRLTLSPGAYGSSNSYTVTATGLTDTAGNIIGTPNSATFSGSATAPATASLAVASDTGTLGDNITGAAFPSPGLQFTGTTTANTTVVLYYSPTVSFTDAGDIVTLNGHGMSNGTPVTFSTIDLTTGVSINTTYYVVNSAANTFQLASLPGGAVLPLTTNGTGILRTPIQLATAVSNSSGNYTVSVTSNTNITQGSNQFNIATVGATGLVSDLSQTFSITYDSVAPGQPTNVTSTLADGTYGIGQVVDIRVTFPEVVLVTGTPQLTLATGTPATTAVNYASGSGTNTLIFNYTVVSGNMNADLNYDATSSLALNGGSIADAAGNAAVLTLPGLAAAGSLATNKALNINGVVSGTITYDQGGITTGPFRTGTLTITATYASAPGSAPTIAIDQQGTNDIAATAMSGGPNVFTYTYTVNAAGGANADGTATLTLSTPSVPATPTFVIDTTNPTAPAAITPPAYTNSTTATGVTYTNGADANFSTHNVRACTSNDCATGCLTATTDVASPVDVSGLSNGTAYYICLQSVDTAGNTSSYVASATTVTVDTTAPTAASGVTVPTYTTAANADVTFTAGTDTNITTSNVRMCTANDCTTGCVGATTGNSPANVSSLVDGTAYYGCVQSRDLAGNTSSWTASAATVTVDTTNPTAPSAVSVPAYSTSTSADITFTAGTDTNITTSNVRMCTSNDCSTGCVGATTSNSPATISSLVNGTAYYGCVQSRDLAGRTSAWVASAATVVIDTTAPTAATGVSVPSHVNTTSAAITFTAGTDTNITTSNLRMCTANDCTTGCVGATTGNSGTSVGSLVNGTAYYGCVQSRDLAGNTAAWVASAATVTVDTTVPTGYSVAIDQSYINNTNRTAVSFTFTGAEVGTTYNYTFSSSGGGTNVTGSGTVASAGQQLTGINLTGLNDGTVTLSVTLTDPASNVGTAATHTRVKDVVVPDITGYSTSGTSPVSSSAVNMTFSEDCASASVSWQSTSGTGHPSGPHVRTLTGSELNAGAKTNITFASNPLLDDTFYTIRWNCTDVAGNAAIERSVTGVEYSDVAPTITSALALDTNYNGKIDTYQVTFSKNISDSTFPGYVANALGTVTTDWLVAGYTSVRLIHGTAVTFATDTANDSVIYIRFNENVLDCNASTQTGCDTDAKPDLTTTATPGVTGGQAMAQVFVGTVTEADGAAPVTVRAVSLGATSLDVTFSEPMTATQANVAGNYTLTGGVTVSAAARDGANFRIVHLTTSTQTGGSSYTLTVNTTLRDLTNINLITNTNPTTGLPANQAQFNGVVDPVVASIVTTSATTLTITFNESVLATSAECANQTACALKYQNLSLPVLSSVSTAGAGNNSASYTLTVNPMIEGQAYTTTVLATQVQGVAAPAGRYVSSPNNSATFNGDGRPAVTISPDTQTQCPTPTNIPPSAPAATRVVVQYDQAVGATATTASNYKITGCITGTDCASGTGAPNSNGASVVTSMGGNKYAVDFTQSFDTDTSQYQLTITGVQDSNSNTIALPGTMSFRCGTDTTPPSLIGASVVAANAGSTVILLTFSESVDNVTANVAGNYKYDAQAYGTGVSTAARQSNTAQVQLTFVPALSNGGHQIRVQNVTDLQANIILDNGVNNVQPVIVNAPTGFTGGPVFSDPFGDGTTAGTIVIYDSKLYLGADSASTKLFEMNFGLTTAQTITLDADGTFGTPYSSFNGYATKWSGCASITYPGTPCSSSNTISGVDAIYAACVGGTSTPSMTGAACTAAGGTESMFIGALNTQGNYRSFWHTTTKSSSSTVFPFAEEWSGDTGGSFAYRSLNLIMFKDQIFVNFGAEQGGGGRGGRVCMKVGGCADGTAYLGYVGFPNMSRLTRIGAQSATTGALRRNGSFVGVTGYSGPGQVGDTATDVLNAISVMYEHDNDGAGGNESQLYLANGGFYSGTLGSARTTNSDGGIVRTILSRSTRSSLPLNCASGTSGCVEYYEDITPDALAKWNTYISIPFPQNSAITGSSNCATSLIEMDCVLPYNIFVPALKAIPYMRTAPNGDLYMLRNACSTTTLNRNGANGAGGFDFRTERQVCPKGYEVPQLWMLPKNCGTAAACAGAWLLVAEYGSTGKTNMASNTGSCGTSPNQCLSNTHATLLEFVGNYLYVGFDNATYGANVWRTDMTSVAQGSRPAETSFSIVNLPGIESGGGGTNQKIFSHVTVNDAGKDWLVIITRDGSNAMKIYRTANDQN